MADEAAAVDEPAAGDARPLSEPSRHDALAAFANAVGAFHITDRAMRTAQERFVRVLATSPQPAAGDVRAYLDAVRRYFEPYAGEAAAQLRHVDRELERLYQVQYNLTAERGVVARRIEAVRGVLTALLELGSE